MRRRKGLRSQKVIFIHYLLVCKCFAAVRMSSSTSLNVDQAGHEGIPR